MSDQHFQRQQDEHEESHVDDPLEELARIVIGKGARTNSEGNSPAPELKNPGAIPQPALSAASSSPADLSDNPFAKFVGEPVEIKERPRKVTENHSVPEVNRPSIFTREKTAPKEEAAPENEDVDDPFADIDLEFPELLESDLAEPDLMEDDNGSADNDSDDASLDLESQLMAELNGEEEIYHPQYVENAHLDSSAAAEQPLPEQVENQIENQSGSPVAEPSDAGVFQELEQLGDEVDDPETMEFIEAFAAEEISVTEQDFESSLQQRLGMTEEQVASLDQRESVPARENSSVQNEIDAVLSSLERPMKAVQTGVPVADAVFDKQNFNAAFNSGSEDLSNSSVPEPVDNPVENAIDNSMNRMSSALAGSINTRTQLPEFPEQQEYVADVRDATPEPQYTAPEMFPSEQDYINDERQIDESVHALQDDLAAQATEIEDAFSDAFAEELSLDIEQQNANNQMSQDQLDFDQQQTAHHASYDQGYQEYIDEDAYADEYVEQYPADFHDPNTAYAGTPSAEYHHGGQPMTAAEQSEFEIDQALAGAIRPERKKNSGFKMAAIALGGAVVIGAGVVGYGLIGDVNNNKDPVLVRADQTDFKVKPDQPGGRQIANQDQPVYVNMDGKKSAVESQKKLVSTNVKPIDLESGRDINNSQKSTERLSNNKANSTSDSTNSFVQPRKVKTVTVRADGTIITSEGTKVADLSSVSATKPDTVSNPVNQSNSVDGAKSTNIIPVPSVNPFVSKISRSTDVGNTLTVANSAQPPAANANKLDSNSSSLATQVNTLTTATEQNVEAQVVKTVKVPVNPTRTTALDQRIENALAANPGIYKVQISSQRSEEAAEATYQNLKQKFASLLDGQPREIRAVSVDGKGTFYRVQIPVGDMPEAASFCKRYKAAGGSCFVTR